MKILTLALAFCFTISAHADERIRPGKVLLAEGYKLVEPSRTSGAVEIPAAHSMPWPISFQDSAHSIGNAMAEFQPFGDPYFHGGCDLRVKARAEVFAPIAGKLEAGHYSYDTNPDGSLKKYWMAWPEEGDSTYFEVAVVADNGIRYEFHHMDRNRLPENIVNMLNQGGGRVEKGTLLGQVIYWPDGDYHHTHYNVILPDGTRVNPEYVSTLVPDHLPPEVHGAYAMLPSGDFVRFGDGKFREAPSEFDVALVDKQDNNVYEHPPVYASLDFSSGAKSTWDFREALHTLDGKFPNLWDFFVQSISTPDGELSTDGGYGMGVSIVRLRVPAGAKGSFTLTLGDIAGNTTKLEGSL